jgi:ketosteroid isomerase-like protein
MADHRTVTDLRPAPPGAKGALAQEGREAPMPRPVESNVSFVGASMEAFRLGDLATVRRSWSYDIVWHAPGAHHLAGNHRGADAIFAYLGQLFELSAGTFDPQLIALESHGRDEVEARFRYTATRWSKRLDDRCTLLIRMAHGNIAEITESHHNQAAWEEFWSGAG